MRSFNNTGVAYSIMAIMVFILIVSLSACGANSTGSRLDCTQQGGKIFKNSAQGKYKCIFDGAIVSEWYE